MLQPERGSRQLGHKKGGEEPLVAVAPAVASIAVWNVKNVSDFLKSLAPETFDYKGRPPGFSIFSDRFIGRERISETYPEPDACPPWQKQDVGRCPSSEFDRALVAHVESTVVGILYCEWKRMGYSNPFWGYHLAFVDVHESYRSRGIASALIHALDTQEWLRGKILQLSGYTHDGLEKLQSVGARALRAQEYILLPSNYNLVRLPTAPGWWSSDTERFEQGR